MRRGFALSTTLFCVLQVVLLSAAVGVTAWRYGVMTTPRTPPEPLPVPIRIVPLHDDANVVDDAQLQRVLKKLRPALTGQQPKINHVDHALRFWGVEAVFDDPRYLSGMEMRELLLDHRRFATAWGTETAPFLVPDTGGSLQFRTKAGHATASHVDHTLAGLAEVGTPLDFPVITPAGEFPLDAAFRQCRDSFSLNQVEYEWSTLVFLHYLPHVKSWYTSEGQEITWDRLADRLMRQQLAQGVCFGNHRMHALVMLLRADEDHDMLSPEGREKIREHLRDASRRLVETQHADGYWDAGWPGVEAEGPQPAGVRSPLGPLADRILATGHALEWLAFAPEDCQPPRDCVVKAGQWLVQAIDDLSPTQVTRFYTFLSHAGRSLALWRGRFPAEFLPLP